MKYVILLLALTGCASSPTLPIPVESVSPSSDTQLKEERQKVNIDPRLLEPCSDLISLPLDKPVGPNTLLDLRGAEVLVHKECRDRNKALSDIIKKAFNLE